jgi:F-type H+-transporting ATPase subunit a
MHSAEFPIHIPFGFFGFDNAINPLTVLWLVTLLLFTLFLVTRSNLKPVPRGLQNFFELIVDFVWGLAQAQVGKHAAFFFPLFFYLFTLIFFCNLAGLIPGSVSPTSRVDVNLGMALVVFLSIHVWGVKEKGLFGYLSHFLPPQIPTDPNAGPGLKALMMGIKGLMWVLIPPIHVISEIVKPVSLTLRLFGNMMGKEKILAVSILLVLSFWAEGLVFKFVTVGPFFLRVLITVLGVFVSFIQAFVFMFLAMVYIGGAVQGHEEHEEAHAH